MADTEKTVQGNETI